MCDTHCSSSRSSGGIVPLFLCIMFMTSKNTCSLTSSIAVDKTIRSIEGFLEREASKQ